MLSGTGGRCLTDPRNSRHPGIRVQATRCNGSPAQLWSVFSNWTNTHHNGLCLSTTGFPYIGPAIQNGAPVRLARCPTLATKWGTDDTLWYPLPDGQIYNQGNGLCLENPGSATARAAKLVMEPCYGSAGEIWAES